MIYLLIILSKEGFKMSNFEFMKATMDDINDIMNLYHSLIGTPGCTWNLDYPDFEIVGYDIKNNWLYTLKSGDKIISVASLCSFDELSDLKWKPKNPLELARLGIDCAFQRQGLGTLMLRKMICLTKEKGFDGIVLLVSKMNQAALNLYEKNGFEKCGEVFRYDNDYYCYQITF